MKWVEPLPEREGERLAALRALKILDTPPEPEFDDLVAVAARACAAPIALLILSDASATTKSSSWRIA